MTPTTFEKQPWEERQLEFDSSRSLATGDSLASVVSVDVLLEGIVQSSMVSGSPTFVGNKVYQRVKGGDDGVEYSIRVRILTTNGDKIEDEITLQVVDT
jgi:predicted alpha/beta superfamily hydrolase